MTEEEARAIADQIIANPGNLSLVPAAASTAVSKFIDQHTVYMTDKPTHMASRTPVLDPVRK
jgi:hypothetical protein